MCGLAGLWTEHTENADTLRQHIQTMTDTLAHRGPDDAATWVEPKLGVGLGFRRLAIMDLSVEGRQPMQSASGRYVMVFNGEVYNSAALRAQLEPLGHRFRGHSDTEVMLAAIEHWGLRPAVERFVGMFAFAVWDHKQRQLSLVRDRLGIKPLYYSQENNTLLFASELKALRVHRAFQPEIDRGALALFMRHGFIPAPYTIYQGVRKVQPGCILTLSMPGARTEPEVYWSARTVAEYGTAHMFTGSEHEAVEQLDQLLREAIQLRMIADVPLGAFLSGGIDSSTVVALMQAQSQQRTKTFSIGFHEEGFDEAGYARAVASHLGTDHTELYVTPAEAQAVIPHLPQIYDEPFADSSQIPTFLVSQLARRHVTVSLSGDGGDELFGGYKQYGSAPALWQKLRWLPLPLRRALGSGLTSSWVGHVSLANGHISAQQLQRLADVLPANGPQAFYHSFISHWSHPQRIIAGSVEPPTALTNPSLWANALTVPQQLMLTDTLLYLPDDILAKVDRASMAVSLEARVPLLDHRVVEFAWQLPLHYKLRDGHGKWILRQVLSRYLPTALIERPKKGFGVPIAAWLRGPLREWTEALLDERRLQQDGFFDPTTVRACWHEHLAGRYDWGYQLWNLVMFQAWLDTWGTSTQHAVRPEYASRSQGLVAP